MFGAESVAGAGEGPQSRSSGLKDQCCAQMKEDRKKAMKDDGKNSMEVM